MAQILLFSRNRHTGVKQIDHQELESWCRLQDTLMDALVKIRVKLPHLEISDVGGEIRRAAKNGQLQVRDALKGVIGVRVGPGLSKIIRGVTGKGSVERELARMVEECCNGVILAFTKEVLSKAPADKDKEKEFFQDMVRSNPRLYNSCAALGPGSPLVEGIEPPG